MQACQFIFMFYGRLNAMTDMASKNSIRAPESTVILRHLQHNYELKYIYHYDYDFACMQTKILTSKLGIE